MLTVPVREPVGNWQEVTVGNTWGGGMDRRKGKCLYLIVNKISQSGWASWPPATWQAGLIMLALMAGGVSR